MSFTRLRDDSENINDYNKITTGPHNYTLSTPRCCNQNIYDNPKIINQTSGIPFWYRSELITTDTKFRFPNAQPNSASSNYYDISIDGKKNSSYIEGKDKRKIAKSNHIGEDSRLNTPAASLKEITIDRFDRFLQENVQEIRSRPLPFVTNTDTRTVIKDNHRPIYNEPVKEYIFPNEKLPCKTTAPTCIPRNE